ncbi:helix-turn-helix domain-containing protein [Streptomyces sp. NPDC056831]|uniref:helix-turn-helix domain-containing protein n=1 Tax=Streptomyces sp. NPDC056831 TaxID=3345954 RepID=UPI0036A61E43
MNDNRSTYTRLRSSFGQQVREAVIDVIERYEAQQAAAQNAVTSSTLVALSDDYEDATTDQDRAMIAVAVADGITLAEAGRIRRAAKAIELGTPGLIVRATAAGMTPNEIARELGATPSYVRRILRENPGLVTAAAKARQTTAD